MKAVIVEGTSHREGQGIGGAGWYGGLISCWGAEEDEPHASMCCFFKTGERPVRGCGQEGVPSLVAEAARVHIFKSLLKQETGTICL